MKVQVKHNFKKIGWTEYGDLWPTATVMNRYSYQQYFESIGQSGYTLMYRL